jgi:hypothetical protein
MSAAEQMDNGHGGTKPETAGSVEATSAMRVVEAVGQLRALVCGLGLALLVLGVVFDLFVFKQNRNLASAAANRSRQTAQMQTLQQQWTPALNALAQYSSGKPELMAIFKKHGIEVKPPATPDDKSTPLQP